MTRSINPFFRQIGLPICIVILYASNPAYGVQDKELNIRKEVRAIQKDFRVQVHYHYDQEKYFPPGSRLERINSSASELSDAEIRRALPIVRIFLSNYPERVLRRHLSNIYLMRDLKMAGGGWGGTYYDNGIYINCNSSQRFMLSAMFHEISSMLLRKYPFPKRAWLNVNGREGRYIGVSQFADGRNKGNSSSKQGLQMGFITNYARSNLENDFNEMSEFLFTRYYQLSRMGKEYPKIGAKMELSIDFYKRIDKDFEFTNKAKL